MANTPDVSKLSYAELKALIDNAQGALNSKRDEELKVLADGYAKKLDAAGFDISEGIEALKAYLPTKTRRARTAARGDKAYTAGTVYKNPKGLETWTGGTKGKLPAWLREYIGDAEGADRAAKFAAIVKS